MWTSQVRWESGAWRSNTGGDPDLVIAFLDPALASDPAIFQRLARDYPDAIVVGCSTGGEIAGVQALDGAGVGAAMGFDHTDVRVAHADIEHPHESRAVGAHLGAQLAAEDLAGVFVLSDGLRVNGSALIAGLTDCLGPNIPISGGLAGDGPRFGVTRVGAAGEMREGRVVAVGFYGQRLSFRCGSFGGWDVFGPKRRITKSAGNVLYELDGKPALDLYKRYLGDEAKDLPGSALLFPLKIHAPENADHDVVRTIIGIDEAEKSLIFAGDMPQGYLAQFMMGEFDRLVAGAGAAARAAGLGADPQTGALALLVSCIGRKLLLGQRIGDEVAAAHQALGGAPTIGFYSYGEICPHGVTRCGELHNQTMTVTVLSEH